MESIHHSRKRHREAGAIRPLEFDSIPVGGAFVGVHESGGDEMGSELMADCVHLTRARLSCILNQEVKYGNHQDG